MTDPQTIRNILATSKAYIANKLSQNLLKKIYGVYNDCDCCDDYNLISNVIEKLQYQIDLNLYNGTTENLYTVLIKLIGNTNSDVIDPDDGIEIKWGYTNTDVYSTIDTATFQFTAIIDSNDPYPLNFTSVANNKYLIIKQPVTETIKTTWFNTVLNNGTIPDQVFYSVKQVGNFNYYGSRIPVSIDSTNSIITFN